MDTKVCSTCKVDRPLDQYTRDKTRNRLRSNCKPCRNKHQRRYRKNNLQKQMVYGAKRRAEAHDIPFDIKEQDITIPEVCPYLGIPLEVGEGTVSLNSPTLDRIYPSKGYTRDNIIVVSSKANIMKGYATPEDLLTLATNLQKIIRGSTPTHQQEEGRRRRGRGPDTTKNK